MAASRISSDSFYSLPTGAKCAELARGGTPAWAGRGGDKARRAGGRARTGWMLQTQRGSAAAAPAPGEMLMGSCRRCSAIGQREFGATSSRRRHWLGAICCSLCRERLAPPPIPFFSASRPPAARPLARHPAASEALGSFLSGRPRGPRPGTGVGARPGQASSTWRRDGHWASFTGSHGGDRCAQLHPASPLPPSQGRVGREDVAVNLGLGSPERGRCSPPLPSERGALGAAPPTGYPRGRGSRGRGRTRSPILVCVDLHARTRFRHRHARRGRSPPGTSDPVSTPTDLERGWGVGVGGVGRFFRESGCHFLTGKNAGSIDWACPRSRRKGYVKQEQLTGMG